MTRLIARLVEALWRFVAMLLRGLTLMSSPAPDASTSTPVSSVSSSTVLELLRRLYGDELAPVLLAVGQVESGIDPDEIGDGGISRGAWQVNTERWGAQAAPMHGPTPAARLEAQATAMRAVVQDASAGAVAFASLVPGGIPFGEAFNLIWQFGRPRARQLLIRAGSWQVDLVARAIDELRLRVTGAMWRARQEAFAAALAAAAAALRGIFIPLAFGAGAGAGGLFVLLLILWLAGKRRDRRRT